MGMKNDHIDGIELLSCLYIAEGYNQIYVLSLDMENNFKSWIGIVYALFKNNRMASISVPLHIIGKGLQALEKSAF